MSMNTYAPIAVFVYNRPEKTRAMIGSLASCKLARESELIVFSDGAKNEEAAGLVNETREYIDTLSSQGYFKEVSVYKSDKNKGLAASVISGITDVLNRYGRVITVEDDLLFSEGFLEYMNKCLDCYENDDRIWSISGYTPQLHRGSYDKDVYLSYRASSWGWGTWKSKWDMVDWEVGDYGSFKFDPIGNMRFCRGGNDLPSMLRAQMKGNINSWAVRWCYAQSRRNMYTVYPVLSLVSNNGLDGTGTHSKEEDSIRYAAGLGDADDLQCCYDDLKPDRHMLWEFYKIYHLGLWVRIRDKIKQLMSRN